MIIIVRYNNSYNNNLNRVKMNREIERKRKCPRKDISD